MERERIECFIEQHKAEAILLLQELGKIPAPSHKEDKRAAFCKNGLRKRAAARCKSTRPKM